jgi:transglutaminase-like putative cysteine protease
VRRYRVTHTTRYEYESPVLHATHALHLEPRSISHQRVLESRLDISPEQAELQGGRDYFGNVTHLVEILAPHEILEVKSTSRVEVASPQLELTPASRLSWEKVREQLERDRSLLAARELCFDSPLVRSHHLLADYAAPTFTPGRPFVDALGELSERIFQEFKYEPLATDISTPLAQVLRERRGVCQDFAQLAVGCLRSLGLAARYVSGYLETEAPAGRPKLIGADASHAWASAFLPSLGWIDFDPTNAVFPGERHVTVAWGRDFSDVSPLRGIVLGGGQHSLAVAVDVTLDEEHHDG